MHFKVMLASLHTPYVIPVYWIRTQLTSDHQELQRILSRSLDLLYSSTNSASGLHENCNYYLVTNTVEAQLQSWHAEWRAKLGERFGMVLLLKSYQISHFKLRYSPKRHCGVLGLY